MNKITIMICALCGLCISCGESSQISYTIKGTVNNMNGTKVYLYVVKPETMTVIDSAIVSNASFTFQGTQPKVCIAAISPTSVNQGIRIPVILENGIINVSFNKQRKATTGTPTNDMLNACNEKIKVFDDKFYAFISQRNKLKENQKDELAALNKKIDENHSKRAVTIKECINQNLNSILGAYLIDRYASSLSDEEIAQILTDASPEMKENDLAKKYIKYIEILKNSAVGQKFIDLKMKDPNDREIALSDYVGKGKYILLEFWASWCGGCREEMPHLKAVYEKFASKGFEIVGVSLDTRKEDWLKAIKDLKLTWPQMLDLKEGPKSKGSKLYGIRFIPSTFLIDPNGIIIARNIDGNAIDKKLEEVLK